MSCDFPDVVLLVVGTLLIGFLLFAIGMVIHENGAETGKLEERKRLKGKK